MPPWYLTDISLWIVTVLVGLVGFVLAFRGLVGERTRGRPTCWQCRYDMTNLDTLTCPECGHVHDGRKRLFKTRRYYKRFILGSLLFMLALHCHTGPQVQYRRATLGEQWWESVVPTTVWIMMLPKLDHERIAFVDARLWLPLPPTRNRNLSALFENTYDDEFDGCFEISIRITSRASALSRWQTRLLIDSAIKCLEDPSAPDDLLMEWIIENSGQHDLLEELLALSIHPKPNVRRTALREVGLDERTHRIMPTLLTATADADPQVRLAAFIALGQMGPRAKQALPTLKAAIDDPANSVLVDLDWSFAGHHPLRDIAAIALARVDAVEGYALFTNGTLFPASVRKSARKAIWYAPDSQYTDLMWAAAINGAMEGDEFFMEVLAQTGGMKLDVKFHTPTAKALFHALKNPDREIRSQAHHTLSGMGVGALPILNWAIDQNDPQMLEDVVGFMIALGDKASPLTHKVATIMLRDPPRFRGQIMDMLAHTGPPSKEVIAVLREGMKDADEDVREMARFTLELLNQ